MRNVQTLYKHNYCNTRMYRTAHNRHFPQLYPKSDISENNAMKFDRPHDKMCQICSTFDIQSNLYITDLL